MKKKTIIAAVLLVLVFVPQAFSKATPYVKATLGGALFISSAEVSVPVDYGLSYTETYDYLGGLLFAINPAGGIEWRSERADGSPGITAFSFEASLGLGFGNSIEGSPSIKLVNPGLMGILSLHLWKFVPYLGLGLSVPMVFSDSGAIFRNWASNTDTTDSLAYSLLNGNLLLGLGFKATDSIMPTLEISAAIGTLPYYAIDVEVRIGCMVRLNRWSF